jgi:hypothetical protein
MALTQTYDAAGFPDGTVDVPGPPAPANVFPDFSANNARAYVIDQTIVLATGGSANPAGAFNGGGTGNKAIIGHPLGLLGIPAATLLSVEYTWRNLLGPGGPNFNPPTVATNVSPYMNLLVDFGGGDLRVLIICSDSITAAISLAIGSYSNPGGLNTLTFGWSSAMAVVIVGAPPAAVPGGVPPLVTVGPGFLDNAYSWAALVAANPAAVILDAFPGNAALFPLGDGGMPAGALVAGMVLVSGDSGNVIKSGKHVTSWKVNGIELL